MALAVRLRNGLLGEAFLGIRRHLAAVASCAPSPAAAVQEQARAAEVLVGQLLQYTALSRPSAVHAAVRMPFGAAEEQVRGPWGACSLLLVQSMHSTCTGLKDKRRWHVGRPAWRARISSQIPICL